MENGGSGRASDAGDRRLRSAVPDDYPLGLIAVYLLLIAVLVAIRWTLPDRAFRDLKWILAVATIPPWFSSPSRIPLLPAYSQHSSMAETQSGTASPREVPEAAAPAKMRMCGAPITAAWSIHFFTWAIS